MLHHLSHHISIANKTISYFITLLDLLVADPCHFTGSCTISLLAKHVFEQTGFEKNTKQAFSSECFPSKRSSRAKQEVNKTNFVLKHFDSTQKALMRFLSLTELGPEMLRVIR